MSLRGEGHALGRAVLLEDAHAGRRVFCQLALGADRALREIAATIGAGAAQLCFDAGPAEGAFELADHGFCRVRRQVLVTAFAIGPQI